MTMYLSNRDVRPTGSEGGEFIESTAEALVADPRLAREEIDNTANETRVRLPATCASIKKSHVPMQDDLSDEPATDP